MVNAAAEEGIPAIRGKSGDGLDGAESSESNGVVGTRQEINKGAAEPGIDKIGHPLPMEGE
jgi:hypothetical protein